MAERFVCIHGHFYQPPRENPWLGAVEPEASAAPHHDWNERITAECYAPNAAAPILGPSGEVERVIDNYAHISFNFGPTLLRWMARCAPQTYEAVLEADRRSRERFHGHGSALAQPYSHTILPLASPRDRRTQISWGLEDFASRFGRRAEGMWLPETAVDVETLEALAEQDVRFTVLAPHQALRVRPVGGGEWRDVAGGRVDPRHAYEGRLPSGRRIGLFFYDGPASRAVAFERLLDDGVRLAARLSESARADGTDAAGVLGHIATDGETYGHHHRHGEMALAVAIDQLEQSTEARLTNYGEFLEAYPPTFEVQIAENTSWSCAHGLERWRSGCGCASGANPDWTQEWRAPLREALDQLSDALRRGFLERGSGLLRDPEKARDRYIDVLLDPSPAAAQRFMDAHALPEARRTDVFNLLEMQRHAMLMLTSCGWFFDDPGGRETRLLLSQAARALELAQEAGITGLREPFRAGLQRVKSNLSRLGDGRTIFDRTVRAQRILPPEIAADYAARAVVDASQTQSAWPLYRLEAREFEATDVGTASVRAGRVRLESSATWESWDLCCVGVRLGAGEILGAAADPLASDRPGFEPGAAARDCPSPDAVVQAVRASDAVAVREALRLSHPLACLTLSELRADTRAFISARLLPRENRGGGSSR